MTIRYSTGFRNAILKRASWRELLNDCVLRVYSGSQPSSADTGATGTLLCVITKAGGTFVAGARSNKQSDFCKVTMGTATEKHTITINGTNYQYTMQVGDTASLVAQGLAALIDADPDVNAVPAVNTTEKGVVVTAKLAGESYSIAVSTTASIGSITLSNQVAMSRYTGLHWGSISAGVISKEATYQWQGSGLVDGTAGWFRISENSDTPTNTSTTAIRVDGSIGTSGADLNLGSTSIQANGSVTISGADFTQQIS